MKTGGGNENHFLYAHELHVACSLDFCLSLVFYLQYPHLVLQSKVQPVFPSHRKTAGS
jgi:hypothetical protein